MKKPYWEMNADELAKATKPFDEPFVIDQSQPLSPARRATWNRVSRKKAPKANAELKRVSVNLEKGLLSRVTALAKEQGVSRSALISQALEQTLAEHK
jgi:Ribbon-helix-helix protein, copG family